MGRHNQKLCFSKLGTNGKLWMPEMLRDVCVSPRFHSVIIFVHGSCVGEYLLRGKVCKDIMRETFLKSSYLEDREGDRRTVLN
jgi:hypothetical protein